MINSVKSITLGVKCGMMRLLFQNFISVSCIPSSENSSFSTDVVLLVLQCCLHVADS